MEISQKYLTVLGSTGSIGRQALDVCQTHKIAVEALSANRDAKGLADQVRQVKPRFCAITDLKAEKEFRELVSDLDVKVFVGQDGLLEMISLLQGDTVLNSIIGGAGLLPTIAAIDAGKNMALANKETLVTAGEIVCRKIQEKGLQLMPVDSEHCAIFQCLQAGRKSEVSRLILTASGGPFFGRSREELASVTPEQALNHPTWKMGKKITIDSATLMNKCFEMIEAAYLFDFPADGIEVCVHRQSIVHSMVEFCDGAVLAQMANPDMRMCIQYALSYPQRVAGSVKPMNFSDFLCLTFEKPDESVFKPLALAKFVLQQGGILPAVLNGVNDEAVALFLDHKISFLDIGDLAEKIVRETVNLEHPTVFDILRAGEQAKERVHAIID